MKNYNDRDNNIKAYLKDTRISVLGFPTLNTSASVAMTYYVNESRNNRGHMAMPNIGAPEFNGGRIVIGPHYVYNSKGFLLRNENNDIIKKK